MNSIFMREIRYQYSFEIPLRGSGAILKMLSHFVVNPNLNKI